MTNSLFIPIGIASLAAMGLTAGIITPRRLSVRRIALDSPMGGRPFLHMSDYHYELLRVSPSRLRSAILRANPSAILFTGDLFCYAQNARSALLSLKEAAGDIPVIMCLGNHEYKAYRVGTPGPQDPQNVDEFMALAQQMGFTIGRNLVVQHQGYNIALLDDFRRNSHDLDSYSNEIHALLTGVSQGPTIVLCHSPATAGIIAKLPLDPSSRPVMVLCGHFHGGQVDLPGHPEYFHFRSELKHLPKHYRGLKVHNGIPVHISRGLGNVVVPIRFASTPEITILDV